MVASRQRVMPGMATATATVRYGCKVKRAAQSLEDGMRRRLMMMMMEEGNGMCVCVCVCFF